MKSKASKKSKQLKAIEKSILHWQRIAFGYREVGEGITPEDCACCKLYFNNFCEDCPIFEYTGEAYCANTPYVTVENAYVDLVHVCHSYSKALDILSIQKLALTELRFLNDVACWIKAGKPE